MGFYKSITSIRALFRISFNALYAKHCDLEQNCIDKYKSGKKGTAGNQQQIILSFDTWFVKACLLKTPLNSLFFSILWQKEVDFIGTDEK